MQRLLLLNVRDPEERRAALLEGGRLSLLWVERDEDRSLVGNVYLARVVRVEPSIGAAFVDLGLDRPAFLPADDAGPTIEEGPADVEAPADPSGPVPSSEPERTPRPAPPPIETRFRVGDPVVVQVARDPIGRKGPAVTTHLSYPGRTLVLMPDLLRRGVSRRITDPAARQRIQTLLDGLALPEGLGVVARTACADATDDEVAGEAQRLFAIHRDVASAATGGAAPALLHGEADFVTRAVRELAVRSPEGTGGPLRVVTDVAEAASTARRALGGSAGEVEVEVHTGGAPLFHVYGVEREVRQLDEPRVSLPGGASLVIHETEAMWTIDVNSGRLRTGDTPEANALETDLLAAKEAARQIRLRDLPGLVVIDFIDCREQENRDRVEETLRTELAKDPARMRVAALSEFMVAEITRRRLRSGPARSGAATCRTCRGRGRVLSPAAVGLGALREVRALLAEGAPRGVLVVCPPEVADDLARRREDLEELRRRHAVPVDVRSSTSLEGDRFEVRRL